MTIDELIAEADRYILPTDVKIFPATTIKAGCKVGTVLRSIKVHAEARIAEAYAAGETLQSHPDGFSDFSDGRRP